MRRVRTLMVALFVTFLWGSSFVLTKMALAELGPLTIAFYRWLIATLAFAVVLPLQGENPPCGGRCDRTSPQPGSEPS